MGTDHVLQTEELAARLTSKNADTVTDTLWKLGVGTPIPTGAALDAFIACISDKRLYVREVATSKAGKWTSEDRISAALVEQILKDRNQDVLFNLIGSMTSVIEQKRWGYQAATRKLHDIALSDRGNKQNRIRALKVLLFANGQIDIGQFASPSFENLDQLKAMYQLFSAKDGNEG